LKILTLKTPFPPNIVPWIHTETKLQVIKFPEISRIIISVSTVLNYSVETVGNILSVDKSVGWKEKSQTLENSEKNPKPLPNIYDPSHKKYPLPFTRPHRLGIAWDKQARETWKRREEAFYKQTEKKDMRSAQTFKDDTKNVYLKQEKERIRKESGNFTNE
jgi:hypothetical protein